MGVGICWAKLIIKEGNLVLKIFRGSSKVPKSVCVCGGGGGGGAHRHVIYVLSVKKNPI